MNYRLLWAKSDPERPEWFHPLWCHLLDVAAVCKALLPRFGPIADLPDIWAMYLVALHDIGKADARFQMIVPNRAEEQRMMGLSFPLERPTFRHEAISADWVCNYLKEIHHWGLPAVNVVQQALRGHHGNFKVDEPEDGNGRHEQWESYRIALAQMLMETLDVDRFVIERFDSASVAGVQLVGITVLSDWIASNDDLYLYKRLDTNTIPQDYFTTACEEAKFAVAQLGLNALSARDDKPITFTDLWPNCVPLRASQRALEEALQEGIPPGLAIIEAPMGEGKTETAIYLAERWNQQMGRAGIYIALPTMATSNQMHKRYQSFLKTRHLRIEPRLIHGMAWLLEEDAPDKVANTYSEDKDERLSSREWFRNAKRALIAPEGVGTVDQALRGALNVKHGFLRLLGLSSRVLIIDEVHSYDEFMTTLMETLLQWCRALRVPVILLSATLSRRQKERLVKSYIGRDVLSESPPNTDEAPPSRPCAKDDDGSPPNTDEAYPLLTFVPMNGKPCIIPVKPEGKDRSIALRFHPGWLEDSPKTAKLAADLVREGGCACILANTVKDAQAIFKELLVLRQQGHLKGTKLYLFHARFRAERRGQIERKVTNVFGKYKGRIKNPYRPKRAILVSTQVVEQSIDVDFDVIISQIAPIDLLLQRCGRLWRHPRGPRPIGSVPELHILLPDEVRGNEKIMFGGTERIYLRETLLRTLAILHNNPTFTLPTDFRPLVEGCYGDNPIPPIIPANELTIAAQVRQQKMDDAHSKALIHLIPEPNPCVFKYAQLSRPVAESEEGETTDYFHAQTRLGDATRPVLVVNDPSLVQIARRAKPPAREMLRRLFLQRVNLLCYWFKDVEGEEPAFEGAGWLRGHLILPMRSGAWHGHDQNGNSVIIQDDMTLGLTINKAINKKGEQDADF